MIQPLRRTHRIVFPLLAVVLPVLVAAALSARRTEPPQASAQNISTLIQQSARGLVVASHQGSNITIAARGTFDFPDTLAYISDTNTVTEHSILLGPFVPGRSNRYVVANATAAGTIVLYSPATQNVIDTLALGGGQ